MGLHPHPTEIRYDQRAGLLSMTFSDGYQIDYPTVFLRGYCPCARCQGHAAGPPSWIQPEDARQITVEDVVQVGSYAVCISWADGHDTGIYSFENLRQMAQRVHEGLPASQRALTTS